MKFFQKMERKFGRYAIHNLMYYIIMLYVVGFVILKFAPELNYYYLMLDAPSILHGQVWRLVTFMIFPPTTSFIWILLLLLMYYSLGSSLERVWGAFRFNVYVFMGILGHIIAELAVYFVTGHSPHLTTTFLNASVFLAYAVTFPNEYFYLYFVIAIRAKWLAIFEGAGFLLLFVTSHSLGTRLEILLSLANFIIFFVMTRDYRRISPREIKRKQEFRAQIRPKSRTRHVCAVCGRTDEDSPGMEFRYCSKCEGSYEYCMDHLYTHKHIKKSDQEQQ